MKKITSILIILLLIFDSCGYIFVYFELSSYFKKEASQKISDFISDEKIELLAFPKSDIEKVNSPVQFIKENEIEYGGSLYDIYKTETNNDSVFYYCVNDEKENILEKVFSDYVENKTSENSRNDPINNIINNIIKVANVPAENNSVLFYKYTNYIIQDFDITSQYSIDIPTPPPKLYS